MNTSELPILYSFRRCPYAMRARLAIAASGIKVEVREILLSNKPRELIDCSAKATVPVLQLTDKTIIDESLDIMLWALKKHDPYGWLLAPVNETKRLIDVNDNEFKQHLDFYKYSSRYPEENKEVYREKGEDFLRILDECLNKKRYLLGDTISLADMAIFPFVRQFAYVDKAWFDNTRYIKLQFWLYDLINSPIFEKIMIKRKEWSGSENRVT